MSTLFLSSRDKIAAALHDHLGCAAPAVCDGMVCVTLTRTREYADALLASGVVVTPDVYLATITNALDGIYAEHGHDDDWGVRVIYLDQLKDALAAPAATEET